MALPTSSKVLCGVYAAIAAFSLVATWGNIGPYLHSPHDFLVTLWQDTAVNGASRFVTADMILLALSSAILMVIEGRRHGVRFVWAYIVGGYFIAISVAFPLFLIARELRIGAADGPRPRPFDTVLLAALSAFAAGLTIWVAV
jgi:hypothetical protein